MSEHEAIPVVRPVRFGTARLLPDLDRDGGRLLTVDGAPQSYVDLRDPTHLEFEYTRRLGHVLDTVAPAGRPLDLLHLGGGALTLPRYAAATRPGSRQRVVEADGPLAALIAEHLPLPPGEPVEVLVGDAREQLTAAPPGGYDLVVADVFDRSRIPGPMTTLGCARAAARALRPGGHYAVNLADAAPFGFLRSQLATLAAVFGNLCLIGEPAVLRGRRFGNLVLLASAAAPLPPDGLARRLAADPFPARLVAGGELVRLTGDASPVPDGEARPSPLPPAGAFGVG
ncbi:fused MFS/spermidine synthase [Streptomyces carpaticus]|uniref:spermidine synthase n=1 Tax=Streptomyces carpaticus TaxID=285558 RepID=UPI0031F9E738